MVHNQLNEVHDEYHPDANSDDQVSPVLCPEGPEEALSSLLEIGARHVFNGGWASFVSFAAGLLLLCGLPLLALSFSIAVTVVAIGLIVVTAFTLTALPLLLDILGLPLLLSLRLDLGLLGNLDLILCFLLLDVLLRTLYPILIFLC